MSLESVKRVQRTLALPLAVAACAWSSGVRADIAPIWQLQVDSSRVARVVVNELRGSGRRGRFPVRELILRRFTDCSVPRVGGEGISPCFRSDFARLRVRADGTLDTVGDLAFDSTGSTPEVVRSDASEPSLPVDMHLHALVSADGMTALVMRPYPGSLQLFDLRGLNPVAVGRPLQTDGDFTEAVVSGDGQVVAVRLLERGSNSKARVVVLDRRLRPRAILLRDGAPSGLRFEGRLLFVGSQVRDEPTFYFFTSTHEIRLYDLTHLGPAIAGVDYGFERTTGTNGASE